MISSVLNYGPLCSKKEGYSVTAVSCPLMTLEHDVSKFHMAILDFAMPVLNGFQLLLRLRASFPDRSPEDLQEVGN
jgi:DNA-binding response OmpR family regulator